jgi:hypothetical protein
MMCETELRLRKVFSDAIREMDSAESEGQSAAQLKMGKARLEFVNHRASCLLCIADHRRSEGLDG